MTDDKLCRVTTTSCVVMSDDKFYYEEKLYSDDKLYCDTMTIQSYSRLVSSDTMISCVNCDDK